MTARFLVGDVFDRLAGVPDGSVDLVLTSPPFLALRSYLPDGHPDKAKEIGSEPTPAEFLDTMLALTAEWRRVLASHGSICVELGDTYAGSGGGGGDYKADGLRAGQPTFDGSGRRVRETRREGYIASGVQPPARRDLSDGWPLEKSLTGIPTLYTWSLAYGRNLLTGTESPAGQWRIRNLVAWVRPNPPVGALGDKFRPATSYLTVATIARDRWFDLDAVRTPHTEPGAVKRKTKDHSGANPRSGWAADNAEIRQNPAGAPPLDWWEIPPGGYSGKVTTTRREPCGPHDGGQRTTSPDCPVHADLPGQLPKALRDARAGTAATRTARNDDHPESAPLPGFAPTDPRSEPPTEASNSGSPPRPYEPAATGRSMAANRTGPAPSTSPAGTPSAQTTDHTTHTSRSPGFDARHPGMSESSTSAEDSPDSPDSRTIAGTAGSGNGRADDGACTCSWHRSITESTSHYAVYPPELCRRPIDAMCPRRVCTTCGTPSRRVTGGATLDAYRGSDRPQTIRAVALADAAGLTDEHVAAVRATGPNDTGKALHVNNGAGKNSEDVKALAAEAKAALGDYFREFVTTSNATSTTTGWSTCGCPGTDGIRLDGFHTGTGWRAGHVLDPFGGSGTTAVVATGLGRTCTLIDIDERNAELARQRLGMFLDIDHTPAEVA